MSEDVTGHRPPQLRKRAVNQAFNEHNLDLKKKEDSENSKEESSKGKETGTERGDSLYPHPPMKRRDALEQAMKGRHDDVIDVLRLDPNMVGFYNLAMILLMCSLLYIAIADVQRFGLRMRAHVVLCEKTTASFTSMIIFASVLFAMNVLSYFLVKAFHKGFINSLYILIPIFIVIQATVCALPTMLLMSSKFVPLLGGVVVINALVVALKQHSFLATNVGLIRSNRRYGNQNRSQQLNKKKHDDDDDDDDDADENDSGKGNNNFQLVSFWKYLHYMARPTLVFEPSYPTASHIRISYLVKKSALMFLAALGMFFIMEQFLIPPLIEIKDEPIISWKTAWVMVRLTIPSVFAWLLAFWMLFAGFLNVLGEITYHEDRLFYRDWWNSTSIDRFWSLWNIPVHEWALRHVSIDTQRYLGVPKAVATFAVFLISALLHELIFSASFRQLKPVFAVGMMLQVPLIYLSRQFSGKRRGNFLVWLGLFTAFPVVEVFYVKSWLERYGEDSFFCVTP